MRTFVDNEEIEQNREENNLLASLGSSSLFLLCHLTSLGDDALSSRLFESSELMTMLFDAIENFLAHHKSAHASSSKVKILSGFGENNLDGLVMSIICTLCNILSSANGRKWFVENCKGSNRIVGLLLDLYSRFATAKTVRHETKVLKCLFANVQAIVKELNLDEETLSALNKIPAAAAE